MRRSAVVWSTSLVVSLLAVSSVAAPTVIVGGGKHLKANSTTYTGEKIITGGSETHDVYSFTFDAPFRIDGVTMRMEEETGKAITASAGQGITGIEAACATKADGPWTLCGAMGLRPPGASATLELRDAVPAGKTLRLHVRARTTHTAARFVFAFATKTADIAQSCTQLDEYVAGDQSLIARPFLPTTKGLTLRIRNAGSSDLGFGRFELVGAGADIDRVVVSDESFALEMDGQRAFSLRGGELAPSQAIEVVIAFQKPAVAQGALVGRFN